MAPVIIYCRKTPLISYRFFFKIFTIFGEPDNSLRVLSLEEWQDVNYLISLESGIFVDILKNVEVVPILK